MSAEIVTGWVWVDGHIVGNPDTGYQCLYNWNHRSYGTRQKAIDAGIAEYGSDDFNVGFLEASRLEWFGWMDEQHPPEDYPSVAEQFGWTA